MTQKRSSLVSSLIAFLLFFQALTTAQITTQEPSAECSNKISSEPSLEWSSYQDNCYSVAPAFFSYQTGKEFCRRNGGFLASVHSLDEMQFIISLVGRTSAYFWIGFRKNYPNEFRWEDGTPVDFVNWRSGDDDYSYSSGFNPDTVDSDSEDDLNESLDKCVSFTPPAGIWIKNSCDNMYPVICKFRKSSEVSGITTGISAGFCPDGWYTFGNNCYKVGGLSPGETKGWNDASSQCEAIGSTLVSVHSSEEQSFLNTLMLEVRKRMWIGLSRPTLQGEFSWKDNSPLDYSNWNEGEPNNHLGTQENCVQLLERSFELGKWNDVPCRLKFPYICKKPRDPSVPQASLDPSLCVEPKGWLKIRNSCYNIFNEAQYRVSWNQALQGCANSSAILASVKNLQVTAELRLHMTDMDGYFWIGIRSTAKHRYTWIGGAPLLYSNWERDQPKDVSEESNCVAMNTEGEWMIRSCRERLPFVCEANEETPEDPTLQPLRANMTCPDFSPKWHNFEGKYCYIIEVEERVKWYEASCFCNKEGGNLASFHSTDEIDLMRHYLKHFNVPLHIGFERNNRGSFVWSDDSPVDFDNWDNKQAVSTGKNCAAMDTISGKWKSIHCSARHGYICSVLKVPMLEDTQPALPLSSQLTGKDLSTGSMAVIITICILSLLVIAAVALLYYYPSLKTKIMGE